jgi:hypothetical protein
MSQQLKLSAVPIRTVMFRPICAYCGNPENHYAHCDYRLAILACTDPEHKAWANRDAKAWLGRNKCVNHTDYKQDPLFQSTDLLSRCVPVQRSSGEIEIDGWRIFLTSSAASLIRFREDDGLWVIPVIKSEDDIQKHIPVRDLKMSLTEDKHGLVDAFEAKLIRGFYVPEMRAYEDALEAQKEMEEPSAGALVPQTDDYIVPALHRDYGVCRVFLPPSPAPSASDPAPPPPLPFLSESSST